MCCRYYTLAIQVSIPKLWEREVPLMVRSDLLSHSPQIFIRTPASKKMNLFTDRQGALSLVQAPFENDFHEELKKISKLFFCMLMLS